jgi:hypothetical protein
MTTVLAVTALVVAVLGWVTAMLALRTLARVRAATAALRRGGEDDESFVEASGRHAAAADAMAKRFSELTTVLADVTTRIDAAAASGRDHSGAALGTARAEMAVLRDQLKTQFSTVRHELASVDEHAVSVAGTVRSELLTALAPVRDESALGLRRIALVRFDAFPELAGRLSFALALLDDAGNGVTLSSIAAQSETRLYAKGVTQGAGDQDLSPEEIQAVKAALAKVTDSA